ncbi:uncharacterized protein LOC132544331 [Ylistrum balloti]|uniref:uncharacterized protein LOC132544331 n=1 Tax=Ylistrum balloti TaxID=509963 RepID=UPI002905EC05|nr:uncharacterized protein LOC132544331 [Ylistrum balloti]
METMENSNSVVFDKLVLEHGGMLATNGHALYQSRDVIMDCLDKMLRCSNTLRPLITVADIGTADGSTSLVLCNEIIEKVRKYHKQIMLHYTDLPDNDFNRMFSIIQEGLRRGPDVFSAAIGRSMFKQCLPDQSTDFIFSSVAAMNLSKRLRRPNINQSPDQSNENDVKALKTLAALDWKTFLVMRGKELRPGGYLVVLNIGTTKYGETTVNIHGGKATLDQILKTMLADGLITKNEFLDCSSCSLVERTETEHIAPFKENDKDLEETGLELVSIRSFVHQLKHPTFSVSNKDEATKKLYADRIVAGIKPWLNNSIYRGLSSERSTSEREILVEKYFAKLWDFAYKNNDQIPHLALVEIVAKRRQRQS